MYTTQQRNGFYKKALEGLTKGNLEYRMGEEWQKGHSGLCELMAIASTGENIRTTMHNFPELTEQRPPESIDLFWWDVNNREIRKQVLLICIEKTSHEDEETPQQQRTQADT